MAWTTWRPGATSTGSAWLLKPLSLSQALQATWDRYSPSPNIPLNMDISLLTAAWTLLWTGAGSANHTDLEHKCPDTHCMSHFGQRCPCYIAGPVETAAANLRCVQTCKSLLLCPYISPAHCKPFKSAFVPKFAKVAKQILMAACHGCRQAHSICHAQGCLVQEY